MKIHVYDAAGNMVIETPSKVFNRQTNVICPGNVSANTQHSGYVRSWWDEGDRLFQNWQGKSAEPGRMFNFDMDQWPKLFSYIRKEVEKFCRDKEKYPHGIIFYEFYHHYRQEGTGAWVKKTHGYVVTTPDEKEWKLVRTFYTGASYKSEQVLDECVKYITKEAK